MGLNQKQRMFVAAYIGEAKGNATEAARIAGYKQPQVLGSRQLENVDVRAEIEAYNAEIKARGIALKENRLARYEAIDERLWQIVEERASDPDLTAIPGGTSGFLVRTFKMASNGDTVAEYQVDTAHANAIRANLQQMAQERGEWAADKAGTNVNVTIGVAALQEAIRDAYPDR